MDTDRLCAFSDGVLAIIITIMVLDLRVPAGSTLDALWPMASVFSSYVLSFLYVGIYWNNHHHLLHTTRAVTGTILWANLHLLFWLSLLPFATAWMGESHGAIAPTALYGTILFLSAVAYWLLQQAIMAAERDASLLKKAVGRDWKGNLSPVSYLVAIVVSHWSPWVAEVLYAAVALVWVIPDRRIERVLGAGEAKPPAS